MAHHGLIPGLTLWSLPGEARPALSSRARCNRHSKGKAGHVHTSRSDISAGEVPALLWDRPLPPQAYALLEQTVAWKQQPREPLPGTIRVTVPGVSLRPPHVRTVRLALRCLPALEPRGD